MVGLEKWIGSSVTHSVYEVGVMITRSSVVGWVTRAAFSCDCRLSSPFGLGIHLRKPS